MTVADQARAFAVMVLCGAGVGLLHDLLAIFRRGAFLTAAADLLLGVACALGVIGAGLMLGCDSFRLYTVLGIGAGWLLYAVSLGMGIRSSGRLLIRMSKKVDIKVKNGKSMQENTETKRI